MFLPEQKLQADIVVESSKPALKSVIWLHGLGADGHDFVPIVSELNLPSTLGVRFIFPHAPIRPITINNGLKMRGWYDIYSLTNDRQIDEAGISASTYAVQQLIENEIAQGQASTDIFLAGFSQGAVIALTTALRYTQPLAGVIALSGYFPLAEQTLKMAKINQHLPIFLAHGTEDPVIPYALGKATYLLLSQASYPVSWHSYPMGHSVCAAEINDISRWLQEKSALVKS